MSKAYYIICAIFFGLFGGYFLGTEQWVQGFVFIAFAGLNVGYFNREIKAGGIDD